MNRKNQVENQNSNRNSFFKKISKKSEIMLDKTRPFVVFLDGANISSSQNVNLLDETESSYAWAVIKTCRFISKKYKECMFIYAVSDEINICVTDPLVLSHFFRPKHAVYATELRDMLLQEFFYHMSRFYGSPVYFHCWYMSLYEDNLYSYLIWRKHRGVNALVYTYMKKYASEQFRRSCEGKKLEMVQSMCAQAYPDFRKRSAWQTQGIVFQKGNSYDIENLLEKHSFREEDILDSCFRERKEKETGRQQDQTVDMLLLE